jgi:hypothetical protein
MNKYFKINQRSRIKQLNNPLFLITLDDVYSSFKFINTFQIIKFKLLKTLIMNYWILTNNFIHCINLIINDYLINEKYLFKEMNLNIKFQNYLLALKINKIRSKILTFKSCTHIESFILIYEIMISKILK